MSPTALAVPPRDTITPGTGRKPGEPAPPQRNTLRLAVILVASFLVVLDFSIVNVALPAMARELHLALTSVQWVVTGYAIAFGGLLILGGRAADLFGRRRIFIAGLLLFTIASLAGGLAGDPALLIVSRVIQGAGAALVAPASLSLIATGFAEGPRRTRALGIYGATASVGFVAGQVLGGLLVQFTSWRAVFLVNVPIGLIAAGLAPRVLAESRAAHGQRRLDLGGALLVTGAVAAFVFAISQAAVTGWTAPPVMAALALTALLGLGFALAERRQRDPLLQPDLIRRRNVRQASAVNLLLGAWSAGEMLVLSLYLQQDLGDTPLRTGLVIAPQGIVGFAAGAFGARLARRIGISRVLVLTGAVATAGFLVLTQLPASGHYNPLLAAVALVGFGTAGTAFGTMVTATSGVPAQQLGMVGGLVNTGRQIGAAIGAALLPAIAEAVNGGPVAGPAGDRAAMATAAALAALSTLIAWWPGGHPVPRAGAGAGASRRTRIWAWLNAPSLLAGTAGSPSPADQAEDDRPRLGAHAPARR